MNPWAILFAVLALVLSGLPLARVLQDRGRTDEWNVWCETKGAHMHHRITGLHLTFWCVKDGRVVP